MGIEIAIPAGCTLYLARHATPDRRPEIPYTLPPGPDLADRGIAEAGELGLFLAGAGVGSILASPFLRAWHTACIAGEAAGRPVEANQEIAEWRPDETEQLVEARVLTALQVAFALSVETGAPVALISHGGPVMFMLKHLGLSQAELDRLRIYDSRNLLPPAGAWQVTADRLQLAFVPEGLRRPVEQTATAGV